MTAAEVMSAKAGIGFRTLQKLKRRLRVESRWVVAEGKGRWEWVWPEDGLPALGEIFKKQ